LDRFVIGTTKISEEKLNKLKEKTGELTTKEALARAVEHYLSCHETDNGQEEFSSERVFSLRRKSSEKIADYE